MTDSDSVPLGVCYYCTVFNGWIQEVERWWGFTGMDVVGCVCGSSPYFILTPQWNFLVVARCNLLLKTFLRRILADGVIFFQPKNRIKFHPSKYIWIIKEPPFLGVSERGRARTCNQWLKRPAVRINFSHPKAYCFRPIHWTVLKQVSWMHVKVGQHFHVQWTRLPTDGLTIIHEDGYSIIIT